MELIEWRSIDLHSINSKSTFRPPQSSKHTVSYSACILGVRLRYRRHGEHGLKVRLEDKCIQYQSVPGKGGFSPCSFHLVVCYVPIKVYLGNLFTTKKILFCSFRWCSPFLLNLFCEGFFFLLKNVLDSVHWYLKRQKYLIKYDLLNLITLQKRFKHKNL